MKSFFLIGALVTTATASPVLAGHANPWTDDTSILNMQYHEENLVRSVGTPGEDEMLGTMVQTAHGKLDGMAADTGAGASAGSGGGHGAGGQGGGGNGGGGRP